MGPSVVGRGEMGERGCNADTGNIDSSLMAGEGAGLSEDGGGSFGFATAALSFINGGTYCSQIVLLNSNTSLRSRIKNSCFGFIRGFQTLQSNKRTPPSASCFHLFLGVWNP